MTALFEPPFPVPEQPKKVGRCRPADRGARVYAHLPVWVNRPV